MASDKLFTLGKYISAKRARSNYKSANSTIFSYFGKNLTKGYTISILAPFLASLDNVNFFRSLHKKSTSSSAGNVCEGSSNMLLKNDSSCRLIEKGVIAWLSFVGSNLMTENSIFSDVNL
jgi:hypothetical protein